MQTKQSLLSLIAKAQQLADAIHQCGMDYVKSLENQEEFHPEIIVKFKEALHTSIWAFEKHQENYSIVHFLQNYQHEEDTDDTGPEYVITDKNGVVVPEYVVISLPVKQPEHRPITPVIEFFIPIDLSIGVMAGIVGFGCKLVENFAKTTADGMLHLVRNSSLRNYLVDSRRSHLGLLVIQDNKIRLMLDQQVINGRSLALICQGVINDLRNLTQTTSFSTITVGEDYMFSSIQLTGLKHFITGRSRLAQLIENLILSVFDFIPETQQLDLDQDIYLDKHNIENQSGSSPYSKLRFFSVPSQPSNTIPPDSIENNNNI